MLKKLSIAAAGATIATLAAVSGASAMYGYHLLMPIHYYELQL
ncbi:hypothetical protein [Okeania hirsuta]|nr:hypothetical protein [Okeania hirsuta]